MAQKVQFIAAAVAEPRLLILDEPFSGLDPVNAEALREAVFDLRRDGRTIVFSTHDMTTAEKMCDLSAVRVPAGQGAESPRAAAVDSPVDEHQPDVGSNR